MRLAIVIPAVGAFAILSLGAAEAREPTSATGVSAGEHWTSLKRDGDQALCFVSTGQQIVVRGHPELERALERAGPGDEILVSRGSYGDLYKVRNTGRRGQPVIIRSTGDFPFNGMIDVHGDYVVVTGFYFKNGQVRVRGDWNRITKNKFRHNQRTAVEIRSGSSYNRVDHNDIG